MVDEKFLLLYVPRSHNQQGLAICRAFVILISGCLIKTIVKSNRQILPSIQQEGLHLLPNDPR